ncbi:MAG: Crp/Fnr family transcriptional regulator [Saprospiraceae bacterium]|nr:MAG: Crp/Fnr family transcriptional regulator [Saprospiraceae bacterium]
MRVAATRDTLSIAEFPLFSCLSDDEKTRLEQVAEYRVKPKFSYIYLPDELSDVVFFLAKGTVKIGTHSPEGKEVIKTLIHPTAMFGELGLIGESRRPEFAQALREEVHIYAIRVADLKSLMRSNFTLCDRIMKQLGKRLLNAESKLESLIFKDARTRIIEFIKEAVSKTGRRVGYEMLLKHSLTHQDIANITCTSRQTVTLVLNELRKSDLIYFNRGKILVRDMAKLA